MIAIDASAVLAILLKEPEAADFEGEILRAGGGVISPVNYWEVAVRARAIRGEAGLAQADATLSALGIAVANVTEAQAHTAVDAARRFGKGTPARLNLGDCFAYALAAVEGDGLLFKGDDFPLTDVRDALEAGA